MLGWGQHQPDGDVSEDSSEVWVVMGSRGLLLLLALLKFTDRKCARWNDFCPSWKICSLETIIRGRDKQGASASPETLQRESPVSLSGKLFWGQKEQKYGGTFVPVEFLKTCTIMQMLKNQCHRWACFQWQLPKPSHACCPSQHCSPGFGGHDSEQKSSG